MKKDLMAEIAQDIAESVKEAVQRGVRELVEPRLNLLEARIADIEQRLKKLEGAE